MKKTQLLTEQRTERSDCRCSSCRVPPYRGQEEVKRSESTTEKWQDEQRSWREIMSESSSAANKVTPRSFSPPLSALQPRCCGLWCSGKRRLSTQRHSLCFARHLLLAALPRSPPLRANRSWLSAAPQTSRLPVERNGSKCQPCVRNNVQLLSPAVTTKTSGI